MTKIDRAEVERVIDDLETKRNEYVRKTKDREISTVIAYQYAIDRLRELL